ncbi:hypothetical protein D3C78_17840 [compost metagenome]
MAPEWNGSLYRKLESYFINDGLEYHQIAVKVRMSAVNCKTKLEKLLNNTKEPWDESSDRQLYNGVSLAIASGLTAQEGIEAACFKMDKLYSACAKRYDELVAIIGPPIIDKPIVKQDKNLVDKGSGKGLRNSSWNSEQEDILVSLVLNKPKDWTFTQVFEKASDMLKGRTPKACEKHWHLIKHEYAQKPTQELKPIPTPAPEPASIEVISRPYPSDNILVELNQYVFGLQQRVLELEAKDLSGRYEVLLREHEELKLDYAEIVAKLRSIKQALMGAFGEAIPSQMFKMERNGNLEVVNK